MYKLESEFSQHPRIEGTERNKANENAVLFMHLLSTGIKFGPNSLEPRFGQEGNKLSGRDRV